MMSLPHKEITFTSKCKKLQSEAERHAQIERDNFILLKHLNKIMTDKRVDNFWLQESPKFLHRIKLFGDRTRELILEDVSSESDQLKKPARNQRCMACNPAELPKSKPIPEERIPWEPKVIREFIDLRRDDRTWIKIQPNQRCHTSIPIQEPKPLTRRKPLLKLRSRTEPNINCIVGNQKSANEKPLTVVLRFPHTVQVALNASMK